MRYGASFLAYAFWVHKNATPKNWLMRVKGLSIYILTSNKKLLKIYISKLLEIISHVLSKTVVNQHLDNKFPDIFRSVSALACVVGVQMCVCVCMRVLCIA